MSSGSPYFVIILQGIDNSQRTLIHELVKKHADDWWHELADVWVVKGGTAKEWRERLLPLVPLDPAILLVLALKTTPGGRWATHGDEAFGVWLRRAEAADPQ